jgi:hypothetical protein
MLSPSQLLISSCASDAPTILFTRAPPWGTDFSPRVKLALDAKKKALPLEVIDAETTGLMAAVRALPNAPTLSIAVSSSTQERTGQRSRYNGIDDETNLARPPVLNPDFGDSHDLPQDESLRFLPHRRDWRCKRHPFLQRKVGEVVGSHLPGAPGLAVVKGGFAFVPEAAEVSELRRGPL